LPPRKTTRVAAESPSAGSRRAKHPSTKQSTGVVSWIPPSKMAHSLAPRITWADVAGPDVDPNALTPKTWRRPSRSSWSTR